MTTRCTWACVPVKNVLHAKQRLGGALSQPERTALAKAMLQDVLDAVQAARTLDGVALLTVDPFATALARARGVRVIRDEATEGHTRVANAAMRVLGAEGAGTVLMLPGDVPLLTATEVDFLMEASRDHAFTLVPSHDRDGSNAIVCSPPGLIPLRYGAGSFQDHLRTAREHGIEARVLELEGMGQDIDHPEDLDFLRRSTADLRAGRLLRDLDERRQRQEMA